MYQKHDTVNVHKQSSHIFLSALSFQFNCRHTYFCRFPRESPTLFFNSSFPGLSFSFRPANPPSGISPSLALLSLKHLSSHSSALAEKNSRISTRRWCASSPELDWDALGALEGRRRDAEPGTTRRHTERKKRRDFGFWRSGYNPSCGLATEHPQTRHKERNGTNPGVFGSVYQHCESYADMHQ